jgi:hypothetical protein
MKKLFYIISCFIAFNYLSALEDNIAQKIFEPLQNSIKLGDFELLNPGDNKKFELPKIPIKKGFVPVLRFKMVSFMPNVCGCNYSTIINVSSKDIGQFTANKTNRMLIKSTNFEFKHIYKGRKFPYWGRKNAEICIPYGPDCDSVDKSSVDNLASLFVLDISDVLSAKENNSIVFKNIRNQIKDVQSKVIVKDCEVGFFPK